MEPHEIMLEPHGGLDQNNLNSIFHLEEDHLDEDQESLINFKLSEYYDVDSIKNYCIGNTYSINIMSLNAQSVFNKVDILKLQLANFKKLHNFTMHVLCLQEMFYVHYVMLHCVSIDTQHMDPRGLAVLHLGLATT